MTPLQEYQIEKTANVAQAVRAVALVITENPEMSDDDDDDDLIEVIGAMAKMMNKRAARALINEINKTR